MSNYHFMYAKLVSDKALFSIAFAPLVLGDLAHCRAFRLSFRWRLESGAEPDSRVAKLVCDAAPKEKGPC